MKIQFYNEKIPKFDFDSQHTKTYLIRLIELEGKIAGDLTVIFCSDEYLLQLNTEYLNHDYYTDIITFDYCENDIVSGDIFISIDSINDNAIKYNVEFLQELNRVLFHGVLHLIGYNDKTQDEKKKMKEKEDYFLDILLKD